jgi:hypothetical protein
MKGDQKFRPYFTAPELLEIISALKEKPSPARLSISRYLESYSLKITHGIVSPSHTMEPNIEQKLGFSEASKGSQSFTDEECYNLWSKDPSSCTPRIVQQAMDYRYRNSLMTTEEERDYEQAQIHG